MQNKSTHHSVFRTLAFQLGVPFLLFVAVLALVLASLIYFSYSADAKKITTVPQTISRGSRDAVSNFFDELITLLTVAGLSLNTETAPDYTFIDRIVSSNAAIMSLMVLSPDNEQLYHATDATINIGDIALTEDASQYIAQAFDKNTPIFSHLFLTHFNTPAIAIFIPIYNKHDEKFRVLEAIVDVSALWNSVSTIANEAHAVVYITDSHGTILLSNVSFHLVDPALFKEVWSNLTMDKNHGESYTNVFNQSVVGNAIEIPSLGWYALSEVQLSQLNADTRQNLFVLAILSLAFVVLVFFSVYKFRSELLIPLAAFRKHGERLTRGEYGARITLRVDNELARLAEVMNVMSESVENQTSIIVDKLRATIDSLDKNSKILIRRDIELSSANEKLRSLDHAKSEFVSIAAHQLRTPLSAIKWAQQMLMDGELGPLTSEQATVVHQSQESVTRMANLVNDLLAADHLEFDRVQYAFADIDLNEVLQHLTDDLQATAKERVLNFTFTKSPVPARIMGDVQRLNEAFLNVLNNAIKYTPMRGSVTVSITTSGNTITLSIKDTGIGIPRADRNRLFEKFVRMDNAKKVDANGSGLGLFIVKKIIEAHHGKIWFNSDEGTGTDFLMEFPKIESHIS